MEEKQTEPIDLDRIWYDNDEDEEDTCGDDENPTYDDEDDTCEDECDNENETNTEFIAHIEQDMEEHQRFLEMFDNNILTRLKNGTLFLSERKPIEIDPKRSPLHWFDETPHPVQPLPLPSTGWITVHRKKKT